MKWKREEIMNRGTISINRRQAAAAIAIASSSAFWNLRGNAQQPAMEERPSTAANAARTSIHYDLDFGAAPQRVYGALLDPKQFAAFTGLAASIDAVPGGAFSLFGGLIVGRNVELIENQRIVQAWRPTHWDAGIYSIVHFEFRQHGAGAALAFDHTGFPAGEYDHLDGGWQGHYWEPLEKFLAANH
jgi:activator of HSP90 ATPase